MKNLAIIAVLLLMIAVLDANSDAAENANAANELTLKQQSIIPIAAFTAHGDIEKLQVALNNGLDNGLTINEIKEVLIQMYAYCGFPRSLNAITAFMTLTEERAAKGIKDEAGPEPSPLPTDKSREQMGRDVRAGLAGGDFPPRGYAIFVPTIDLFLKEHLFADIFGRDNLDYQSREIATVSALASLSVPQLRGHVSISMRIGLSEAQMNNLAYVLNDKVGKREADLVRAELKTILDAKKIKNQEVIEMKAKFLLSALLAVGITVGGAMCVRAADKEPLVIQEQGSFTIGGTVITDPGTFDPMKMTDPQGQTFHGDHAYTFYQIPVKARKLPIVFLHGAGQFSKTWETTPDGREGFQNIFLRRGFGVYLLDQPRRGDAGRSTLPMEIKPTPDEQMFFSVSRVGNFPEFHEGVQFPKDAESLNQFFRQTTPNTGPYDAEVISDSIVALFDKIGGGILVTHSQGGGPGWFTAMKSSKVNAIISYEPGLFIFPEGEVPPDMPSSSPFGVLKALGVPKAEFDKLTKLPIVLYFGDNIPEEPSDKPGQDNWRTRFQMAKLWTEAVNKHGGDVTLVHLPKIGIKGNTHFPFSDLNNIEVADEMSKWLKDKKLDL